MSVKPVVLVFGAFVLLGAGYLVGRSGGGDPLVAGQGGPDAGAAVSPDAGRMSEAELEQQCAAGDVPSCVGLGIKLEAQGSDPAKATRARALYDQACTQGNQDGCAGLGRALHSGFGGDTDISRALTLFEKACEAGSAAGCSGVGLLYTTGREPVVADHAKGHAFLKKGCDGGDAFGCVGIARMSLNGMGVPRDIPAGLDLLERTCTGGSGYACRILSIFWREGIDGGPPANPTKAAELLTKACELEDRWACERLP